MSPGLLRRYRADRLLREEFETLREAVIGAVAARLRACGACPDRGALDSAYAQAWQGLYVALLEGREIANPAAWLTVVAHRRAVDEHRSRERLAGGALEQAEGAGEDSDIAAALDDRARLHSMLEALRTRLSERERRAATLCYLQGLSRAEAAARMGISEPRMRKLMEGSGRGLRGVAAKVGALARTIAAGEWCEQQGSLMRGLAFGVLDPRGERYRLALAHAGQCPACRAYVRSLRGLAAILPPSPLALQWIAAGAGGAGATAAGASLGGGAGTGGASGLGFGGSGASLAPGAAGAAGGSWWLAGGVGAKLAVGCVLVAGLGAGCVALESGPHRAGHGPRARRVGRAAASGNARKSSRGPVLAAVGGGSVQAPSPAASSPLARSSAVPASARAPREFGPERPGTHASSSPAGRGRGGPSAQIAARSSQEPRREEAPTGAEASAPAAKTTVGAPAAQREFAPG